MRLNRSNFFPFLYDAYGCVKQFHEAFELPVRKSWADSSYSGRQLRATLMREEFNELLQAPNPIEKLDAYCDLLYVTLGTMLDLGHSDQQLAGVDYNKIMDFTGNISTIIQNLASKTPCFRRLGWGLPDAAAGIAKAGWTLYPSFDLAFREVHRSNMTKLWEAPPEDKTLTVKPVGRRFLVKRADGKVLKPPTYSKADLTNFV